MSSEGIAPPHDLESEAAVLSVCLIDPVRVDEAVSMLRPEHFYSEAHSRIFEAVVALRLANAPADIVTVLSWLRDRGRDKQAGGPVYLTDIINSAPAIANVGRYARVVRDKWRVRELARTMQEAAVRCYHDYGDPQEFIEGVEAKVFALAGTEDNETGAHVNEVVKSAIKDCSDANARGGGISGLSTGFDRLDRITGGLHGSDLTIIAARTGMGKTAFALDLAVNVATGGTGVAFFSLEMPSKQIGMRLICSRARIDLQRFQTGQVSHNDWARITVASKQIGESPLFVDDAASITTLEIRAKAKRLQSELARKGQRLGLIVVDYLQLVRPLLRGRSRENDVAEVTRGLKFIAMDMNLPVIALAQIGRDAEKDKDKRPQLRHLRESGEIEMTASNVFMIYRPDYYAKQEERREVESPPQTDRTAEIIVAKQRNGPVGMVRVAFDREFTKFSNMSEHGE